MDATAIKEISRLTIASETTLQDIPAIVIPDGYKLQRLEEFEDKPNHFRAAFSTTVLTEFIDYINKYSDENTGLFIDQQKMTAQAIIDMGDQLDPLWGKHRAYIKPLETTAYKSLLQFNNEVLKQQDFIDFSEDWKDNITFYADDTTEFNLLSFATTIKTLRRLKISTNKESEHTINNFSASKSALESIEIKAGQDELPSGFTFEVIPYEGFNPVAFICQLRSVNDDKSVNLKYRIGQLSVTEELIANKFRDKLINTIKPELSSAIFIGKMDYQ